MNASLKSMSVNFTLKHRKFSFTIVLYVPKWKDAVMLLSTQHGDHSVAADDKKKPDIITYY